MFCELTPTAKAGAAFDDAAHFLNRNNAGQLGLYRWTVFLDFHQHAGVGRFNREPLHLVPDCGNATAVESAQNCQGALGLFDCIAAGGVKKIKTFNVDRYVGETQHQPVDMLTQNFRYAVVRPILKW